VIADAELEEALGVWEEALAAGLGNGGPHAHLGTGHQD
jgi:hypothetical protein